MLSVVVILFDTALDQAISLSELLRVSIENGEYGETGKVTCSFGVAQIKNAESGESLMRRVDSLRYKAKESGRNKVGF